MLEFKRVNPLLGYIVGIFLGMRFERTGTEDLLTVGLLAAALVIILFGEAIYFRKEMENQ